MNILIFILYFFILNSISPVQISVLMEIVNNITKTTDYFRYEIYDYENVKDIDNLKQKLLNATKNKGKILNLNYEIGENITNKDEIIEMTYEKLKNIFDEFIIFQIYVNTRDRNSKDFYCNKFKEAFKYVNDIISEVSELVIILAKKKKFKLEYNYNELIDEKEIKNKIMHNIEKKGVPAELKTAIKKLSNKNFVELIKEEISECEKLFNSENSWFCLDLSGDGSVSNPKNRLKYISEMCSKNLNLDFCYRFYEKNENTLKVVFDDEITKNPEYKVIIRDTDGNILND